MKIDNEINLATLTGIMKKGCYTCEFNIEVTKHQCHCIDLDVDISGFSGKDCLAYKEKKSKKDSQ